MNTHTMLILFDVDATLITTSRAGVAAMGLAGRALFDATFDESRVEYAGRLDPLIIQDLLRTHGHPDTSAGVAVFRGEYARQLDRLLSATHQALACPGVLELLKMVEASPDLMMGLLTGNFPETGAIKLRAAGIDPDRFPIQVWGCDSPHDPPARDHLTPVALGRYAKHTGQEIEPHRVVVVGDTPHDVACAHAIGCRSLAGGGSTEPSW